MSLYGALFTGVSGLAANSRALSLTSNNIANLNTIGYKGGEAQFTTLLASAQGTSGFASAGVRAIAVPQLGAQGLLQATDSATDIAISGNGFFAVTPDLNLAPNLGELLYTRAGAFSPNADGFLRNAAGLYLQGWALDDQGAIPANRGDISPINLSQLNGTAQATDAITLRANLQASATPNGSYAAGAIFAGTAQPEFERTIEIFDSLGGSQPLRMAFIKTATNGWAYELIYDGDPVNIGGAANNPVATGTLSFNSDGTLANVDGAVPASGSASITMPWAASSGLTAQTMTLSFGTIGAADGFTQFDSISNLIGSEVNGALFGSLAGVRISEEGVISALFDNGVERAMFKLPIAVMPNPNGLSAVDGNAYRGSDESGTITLLEAGTGGAGKLATSSLEGSTVDLAEEFTDLITTQRAYSAATKIITTADEMLEEMIRVKR